MPAAVATMLGEPSLAKSLPVAVGSGWFSRFNEALECQASCFLSAIPPEELPWRGDDEWVACVESRDGTPHAIVALGPYVAWDPAGERQGGETISLTCSADS